MGKASRNRNNRNGKSSAFPDFPYDRKFTKAEVDVILERKDRLVDAFRDAVGPQGWGLGVPEDFLHQLMLHGALAGVDVDPAYPGFNPDTSLGAFIRPKRLPDASGRFVDSVEWIVIKDDNPRARRRDARAEAKARYEAMTADLPHDVRSELAALFGRAGQAFAEHDKPSSEPEPLAAEAAKREEPGP